jgi:hypothetical protein
MAVPFLLIPGALYAIVFSDTSGDGSGCFYDERLPEDLSWFRIPVLPLCDIQGRLSVVIQTILAIQKQG